MTPVILAPAQREKLREELRFNSANHYTLQLNKQKQV